MKKIITCTAILFMSALSFGQDCYTVKMKMKIEGLPPEYAAMGDQETVTYIKGDKSKVEMTSMMGSQIMLSDGKNYTFLNDAMGAKTGYKTTTEEMEMADKGKTESKPKIEYTSEKKKIAGYECTKAIVTSTEKETKDSKIIVWVTDKIKYDAGKNKGGKDMMDLGDIKGYPLEMEIKQSQQGMDMKILMTATDVSTAPLADATFNVSTEGYTMTSYQETMAKMKAMRGK
jgi:hypothetical protein